MLGKSEDNIIEYLRDEILKLREYLASASSISIDHIHVSFPLLSQFYLVNNIHKSSWAIFTKNDDHTPNLLYTGNFLIQGNSYGDRSSRSPFGSKSLSSLTSLACTYSSQASNFKMNWTLDLDIFQNDNSKLKLTRNDYQNFLSYLNNIRAHWLLHLAEESNIDFAIVEFSEPSDPLFFLDLDNIDSTATKIKTYFKPVSQAAINVFRELSLGTEFEGRFLNFQPGTWIRDDVLIEMEKFNAPSFQGIPEPKSIDNPFKTISNLSI